MESKTKLLGHPAHTQMVVFPLGLFSTATAFDSLALFTKDKGWAMSAHRMMGAGLITGLVASVLGLRDWLAIPRNTRAWRIGLVHGAGNWIVNGLFGASWWLRRPNPEKPTTTALALSFAGSSLSLLTAWLGGELVDRLGVGVDDGANLNAPNSLSGQSAKDGSALLKEALG